MLIKATSDSECKYSNFRGSGIALGMQGYIVPKSDRSDYALVKLSGSLDVAKVL